jgi:hypothetical protein
VGVKCIHSVMPCRLPVVLSSRDHGWQTVSTVTNTSNYYRLRFPPDIISQAVWLYHRFCLSFRDGEDLLAQRGIAVSYETIRRWCRKFGGKYARVIRHRQGRLGDIWHMDELFVIIWGQRRYLCRCEDSSPPAKRNDSCRFMESSKISSDSGATC